ncbi:MAG: DMT family transporter, partial [Bacilli bacterium]
YGVMPIFAKIAYANGSNPTSAIMFRFYFAVILLLCYFLITRQSVRVGLKQLAFLLLVGFFGYTITTLTLFMSYDYLGAGLATALHFVYPAFVCLFGWLLFRDRMSRTKWLSLALSSVGVYFLIAGEDANIHAFGAFLAVFSGVTYAINVIALNVNMVQAIPSTVRTFYIAIGAAVGMNLYGLYTGELVWTMNAPLLFSYIGLALVSSIGAIVLLILAMKHIGAATASILGTFEPVVSIVLGVALFAEPLTASLVFGTFLILLTTVLLAREKTA